MDKEIDLGLEISDYFDCKPFTHKQAYAIEDILNKKFDSKKVKRFIEKLRDCCEGAACILDQPDRKTYQNDRKVMMATLEKSKKLMDAICDARAPIVRLSTFHRLITFNEEYETGSELALDCQEMAVLVSLMIGILIRKLQKLDLENEEANKGRPTADSKGIVAEIASVWEACFEKKPNKYIGPFHEVVQIVLEGLDLKHKDPQRKINEALKNKTKLE